MCVKQKKKLQKARAAMSFTDQKPRMATEEECQAKWSCGNPGEYFRCAFCGYKFKPGDYWRWHYTNSTKGAGGNPMVCEMCDMDDRTALTEKWRTMIVEAKERMWVFTKCYFHGCPRD